jgi:segregation and condensation protein B
MSENIEIEAIETMAHDHLPTDDADTSADDQASSAGKKTPRIALPEQGRFEDVILLRHIIEGAILAAAKPLSIDQLRELFEEHERPSAEELRVVLEDIRDHYQKRGFELREIGSGWRFQVVQDVAPWVSRLWEEKPQRYSRAVLETLALIAYRQPITRGDIEDIRGVQVASNIIKTLLERDWVRVVGHKDVPGRPALFATTRKFLDYFNLKSLDELPSLAELRDLESLNHEMVFDTMPVPASLSMPADEDDVQTDEPIYEQTAVHEDTHNDEFAHDESGEVSDVSYDAESSVEMTSEIPSELSADDEHVEELDAPQTVVH